ncbi:MAG: Gfo/Idh/MocA family oxidoreductase [Cyclobacteriaceae bacterium]
MQRRKFINNGIALGSALAMGPSLLASAQQKPLKVGVIGTGSRGTGLMRLMNKIDGYSLVGCADTLPFRLKNGLEIAPEARGFEDYRALLDRKDIDAVVIATPFSTHDEVANAAIQAGKHVFCEKTMAKGISEIQSVIDLEKRSDKVFQTGHQYHSSLLYKKAVKIIQSGYIGEVTAVHCQWNRNGNWRRPVEDEKYERLINWRMYKEYSGGLVAELMSHQIDFINWFSGSLPAKFTGFGGIDHWKDGRETHDNIHLLMEYDNGMDASFTCTTTNSFEDYKIKVLGSKATLILDYTTAVIYAESKELKETGLVDGVSGATIKAWEAGKGAPVEAPGNDPTIDALKQFHASVTENKPIISDIKTGATTAKCVQISLDCLYEGTIKYWKDYPELNFA